MARKLFLTPPSLPDDVQCRGLFMPASQEWLAVFSEALSQTTYAHNYEQVHDTDLTPEQAAATAYNSYVAWLESECDAGGGGCVMPPPFNVRPYRISPTTGHYEYIEDDVWVEDPDIPPTPSRPEPTPDDRLCAASSNAVEVLRLTWVEAKAQFDASIAAQDALMDTVDGIATVIGAVFYPPILAVAAITQVGWEIVYAAYAVLSAVDWDEQFTYTMTCLFLQHASDMSDTVTFDLDGVLRDLWGLSVTGGAYLTMAAQMQWILGIIGPDGMNAAGALDLVDGECFCDEWCFESDDFSMWERMRGGYIENGTGPLRNTAGNPDYGHGGVYGGSSTSYAEFRLRVDTPGTTITDFRVLFGGVNASIFGFVPTLGIGSIGHAGDSPSYWWPANYAVPTWNSLTGLSIEQFQTEFYVAFSVGGGVPTGGPGDARRWQVRGTGVNPFTAFVDDGCSYP